MISGTNKASRQPPSTSAATRKPPKAISRESVKGKRYSFPTYGKRRISLLEASKDKIPFSRTLLDSIHATEYPADSAMLQRLQNLREVALLEGMLKTPSPAIYRTYVKEYPDGKFIAQVNASENVRLYQLVKAAPTPANFKAFFNRLITLYHGYPPPPLQ